ncbi:hypothetical protein L0F63_000820, partial [Massospora cicadina]
RMLVALNSLDGKALQIALVMMALWTTRALGSPSPLGLVLGQIFLMSAQLIFQQNQRLDTNLNV